MLNARLLLIKQRLVWQTGRKVGSYQEPTGRIVGQHLTTMAWWVLALLFAAKQVDEKVKPL